MLNRKIGLILFKVFKNKYAYFDVYLYHDLYDKIDFFEKIEIYIEKQLLFKWSCKNSHVVATERARRFVLYLFDFSVILHPVFQFHLSVTQIWAYCILVQLHCKRTEVCSVILVSKVCVCDICTAWASRTAALQNIYFLLLLQDFLVFPQFSY